MPEQEDIYGLRSPGGFVFGVSGWMWGEPRPKTITFFLDNTAKVSDQHGRPIRGAVIDNKELRFAIGPPDSSREGAVVSRPQLATHAQVVAALAEERIDWRTLTWAGWPQLPYAELKKVPNLPPTPIEEIHKIRDSALRKDALRVMREANEARVKESAAVEGE